MILHIFPSFSDVTLFGYSKLIVEHRSAFCCLLERKSILGRIVMHSIDAACCYQCSMVSLCVCLSVGHKLQPWALQKRLNRSRCRLGCGLGWAQVTMYYVGYRVPPVEGANLGGHIPPHCKVYADSKDHNFETVIARALKFSGNVPRAKPYVHTKYLHLRVAAVQKRDPTWG